VGGGVVTIGVGVGATVTGSVVIGSGTVVCGVGTTPVVIGSIAATVPMQTMKAASRTQQTVRVLQAACAVPECGRNGDGVRPMNLSYLFMVQDYKKIR